MNKEELRNLATGLKAGMLDALGMTAEQLNDPGKRGCSIGQMFWIAEALLADVERKIVAAGFNPKDPFFGPDVRGFLAEVQVEAIADGETPHPRMIDSLTDYLDTEPNPYYLHGRAFETVLDVRKRGE